MTGNGSIRINIRGLLNGRHLALLLFCAATVLLVPLQAYIPGAILWLLSAILVFRDKELAWRRRMGLLLTVLIILAVAPIHTDLSNEHFLALGIPFLAVVVIPAIVMGLKDPGVIRYRFWPRRPRGGRAAATSRSRIWTFCCWAMCSTRSDRPDGRCVRRFGPGTHPTRPSFSILSGELRMTFSITTSRPWRNSAG